jgi:SSS family solute:Na+ symporter
MTVPTNFGVLDWILVAVYLLGSLAAGIYAHRYVGRLQDYLVAGRTIKRNLGVATMIASELGLITLMYMAQQGFKSGPAAIHIAIAYFLGVLVIGLSGFVIYRLRATGVMTVPEYYELRYSKRVRWLGGVLLAASGILNMGIFLQVDAKFIVALTGLQDIQVAGWEAGLALRWVMILMMAIVLVYTALGGMVSVIVTDLLQFVVLSVGMLLVTVAVVARLGWSNVFTTVERQFGAAGFDPLASPEYGWSYVLWMVWISLAAGALWHSATLRALASRSPAVAKQVFAWSSIGFLARFAIPIFWGLCAYVYVWTGPPELRGLFLDESGRVRTVTLEPGGTPTEVDTLYALPVMIGQTVPTVLLGLICAGMLAASMSTYSSYLLCWSSVLTQDVIAPLVPGGLSPQARIALTRVGVVVIGVYLVAFGLFYYTADIWKFLAGTGTIYLSGASAAVTLGLYWRRASSVGAAAALLLGLLGVLVAFQEQFARSESFAGLASESALALITVAVCWGAMIVLSLLFPDGKVRAGEAAAKGGSG